MSAPIRHFIQAIEGEHFTLLYVRRGTVRDEIGGGAGAEWTPDPAEREEWDLKAEAQEWCRKLHRGIVVHTDLENPDPEEEARLREKHEPPPVIPDEYLHHPPPPGDRRRWWDT